MKTRHPRASSAPPAAQRKSKRSTARAKPSTFGKAIRNRRRERNLTQGEVASRIKTSTPYVAQLELGKRHPSDKIVTRLAEVLGLDQRELFLLANPHIEALVDTQPQMTESSLSAWEQLRQDEKLQREHNITNQEMDMLSQLERCYFARFGSARDLIFVLRTMRQALRK